jgi:hypothetical protein
MKRREYMKRLAEAVDDGRITPEAYDAAMLNLEVFCEEDEEDEEDEWLRHL